MNKVLIFLISLCALSVNLFSVNEKLLQALCDKDYKAFAAILDEIFVATLDEKPNDILEPIAADHDFFKNKSYSFYKADGLNIFHVAALKKDYKAICCLVDSVDKHIKDEIAQIGTDSALKEIITYHHKMFPYINCKTNRGVTPLGLVCYDSYNPYTCLIAEALIQAGAFVDGTTFNPLLSAVKTLNYPLIELLLQNGASSFMIGQDSIHDFFNYAFQSGRKDLAPCVIEILLSYATPEEYKRLQNILTSQWTENMIFTQMSEAWRKYPNHWVSSLNKITISEVDLGLGWLDLLFEEPVQILKEKEQFPEWQKPDRDYIASTVPDFVKQWRELVSNRYGLTYEKFHGRNDTEVPPAVRNTVLSQITTSEELLKPKKSIVNVLQQRQIGKKMVRVLTDMPQQ